MSHNNLIMRIGFEMLHVVMDGTSVPCLFNFFGLPTHIKPLYFSIYSFHRPAWSENAD